MKKIKRKYWTKPKHKWIFLMILVTLIGGLSLLYYYFDPHQQFTQVGEVKPKTDLPLAAPITPSDEFVLKTQIEAHQAVLKTITDPHRKENLQKIITYLTQKQTEGDQKKNINTYLQQLKVELKEKESKINDQLPLAEKHFLTEAKLKQEKEILYLEAKGKMWQEKAELVQILKGIKEKLQNSHLTTQEKTNFTKDQENLEKKIETITKEMHQINEKIQLRKRLAALNQESQQATDETIKACFQVEKEAIMAQLEPWQ
ncbi:MAG: hypothetical protein Q8888_02145 [Vigna little leaf phytoplasma]|nr:hypothetical protein [Vigna little leaf phytoplasma]